MDSLLAAAVVVGVAVGKSFRSGANFGRASRSDFVPEIEQNLLGPFCVMRDGSCFVDGGDDDDDDCVAVVVVVVVVFFAALHCLF